MLNILPVGETTEQLRTLQHGENVFHEALAHVKDGETRFYVSNPDGEDYMLAYIRNMDMFPEAARAQLKMTDGKDLFHPYLSYDETDLSKLCLDFFRPYKAAMFETIDEYSLVCAKLILQHTDCEVYFTDPRAAMFLPASVHLHLVEQLPETKENKAPTTLYVIPGVFEIGYIRKDFSYISSMPLFHNVFFWQWLVTKPMDQIRYVEMILYKDFGLGAILNRIYSYNRFFSDKGWKAFLSPGTSRYSDELLMRYFEISGRPEDATEENTIVVDNMAPLITTWKFQQFRQGIGGDVLKPEFKRQLDEYADAVLGGKKALGVLIRGSDYIASGLVGINKQATPEEMFPMIDQWMEEDGYDILFLATEDRDVYQTMLARYGRKLRAISQERFSVNDFKGITMISELEKEINSADTYAGAVEDTTVNYIYAVYTLSRCDSVIASGLNNGYNMALALNDGHYRRVYQFLVDVGHQNRPGQPGGK